MTRPSTPQNPDEPATAASAPPQPLASALWTADVFTPYSASAAHSRLGQPPLTGTGPLPVAAPRIRPDGPPAAPSGATGTPRSAAGERPPATGHASGTAAPSPNSPSAPRSAGAAGTEGSAGAAGQVAVLPHDHGGLGAAHDRGGLGAGLLAPPPDAPPDAPSEPGPGLRILLPQPGGAPREAPGDTPRTAPGDVPRGDRAGTPAKRHRGGRLPGGRTAALVATDGAAALLGLAVVGPHGSPVLPLVLLAVLYAAQRRTGLYQPLLAPATLDEVPSVALGTTLAWGFAAAALAATHPRRALDWSDLLGATALTLLACVLLRALVHRLRRSLRGRRPVPALIVGDAPAARHVAEALRAHPEYGLEPVALGDVPAGPAVLAHHAAREGARHVLLVGPHPAHPAHGTAAGDEAARHPRPAHPGHTVQAARTAAAVAERLAGTGCRVWRVEPAHRSGGAAAAHHLWAYACRPVTPARTGGKRATDVVLAGAALLALSPVLAGCALAVRLADGPGVLFRQERIGRDGLPFTLLKFRTLRPRDEDESATRWSIADDSRMSGVGRLLRKSSLDELPQLWNVLRGDMSLVGPRPERPHFVEEFSRLHPGYADRHRMPAGLTGLAQAQGLRGDTSIADRARFDNHYIDTWSWWRDVAIMLRTAAALLRPGGS